MPNKTFVYQLIVISLLFILANSCKKDDKKDDSTPTPTPTLLLHVNAIIISGGNPTNLDGS